MTACCEVCQHPACWKAEIDIRRSALRNECGYFSNCGYQNNSSLRYDARSESIVKVDGSLPTYKTLDLLASGFPSAVDPSIPYTENVSECNLPQLSFEEAGQLQCSESEDNQSFPCDNPINKSLTNYIKKLCDRPIDVERQEHVGRKDLPSDKIIFKTLRIEDVETFGDEYTKVYTWVPGKISRSKSAETRESKEKGLALKMIDGADLPNDCTLSDENKHRLKTRSQPTGYSSRRRTIPYHMPPLGSEEHEDYIQLLRYIDLTRLKCNKVSMNNQNVRIPSQLQTASVKLYESSSDNKTPKHVSKPKTRSNQGILMQPADRNMDDVFGQTKTMYIRNGVLLSKSPVSKITASAKGRKRTPLQLTRVSVPKKAVRKLPLFDHCSSSIKKADLPDVTMKPISSSENTSVASSDKSASNSSLAGDISLSCHNVSSSPDLAPVPPCSPLSAVNEIRLTPTIHPLRKRSAPECDITDLSSKSSLPDVSRLKSFDASLQVSGKEIGESASSGRHYLNFDCEDKLNVDRNLIGTRVTPSTIISKASKTDTPLYRKEIEVSSRQSPSTSLGSKGSLDGWLLDKDIISRTYDKYQSFSPFKTPQCSAHVFRDDMLEKSKRINESRMLSSRRQILPASLHNLDQFLPPDEESLRPNTPFTMRCLSPSRSMFIRQQKQPTIEMVPSEIMVSRFPLLPAITKSQKSMCSESFSHKLHETGNKGIDSCNIDDEEEGVEEVLLNKEAYSAFHLFQYNPQPVEELVIMSNDQVSVQNNMQTADDGLPSRNKTYTTTKNENIMNITEVNDGRSTLIPSNKYNNNFLLQPGDNIILHSNQNDDEFTDLDPCPVMCTTPYSSTVHPNTPVVRDANINDSVVNSAVGGENMQFSDENILSVTPKHIPSSDNNIHIVVENKCASKGNLEDSIFGEFAYEGDCVLVTPRERGEDSESTGDSMYALTPVSINDNLMPNLCIPVEDQINDGATGIDYMSPGCTSRASGTISEFTEITTGYNQADMSNEFDTEKISPQLNYTQSPPVCDNFHDSDSLVIENNDVDQESIGIGSIIIEDSVLVVNDVINDPEIEDSVIVANDDMVKDTEIEGSVVVTNKKLDMEIASGVVVINTDVVDVEITENIDVVEDTDFKSVDNSLNINKSVLLKPNPSLYMEQGGGSQMCWSGTHLPEEPIQSVMKEIFNSQVVEKSSIYLTPVRADDLTEGLDLNLELEEEIVRAMDGLEEFVLDDYEVENN